MVQTVAYPRSARLRGYWLLLCAAVFLGLGAYLRSACGAAAAILPLGLGAMSMVLGLAALAAVTGSVTWDQHGLTRRAVFRHRSMAWAEAATIRVCAGPSGCPRFWLTDRSGHRLMLELCGLGEPLFEELRRRAEPHLAAQRQALDGPGLELRGRSRSPLGFYTERALVMASSSLCAVSLGSCSATDALAMVPVAIVILVTFAACSRGIRIDAEGLHHGRRCERCLAWPAVEQVTLRRGLGDDGSVCETLAVQGEGNVVVLPAHWDGYLAVCAAVVAKAGSATITDRSGIPASDLWRALLAAILAPDAAQEDAPLPRAHMLHVLAWWLDLTGRLVCGAALVLFCCLAVWAEHADVDDLPAWAELATGGVPATARVTEPCPGHDGIRAGAAFHYTFAVKGRHYTGHTRGRGEHGRKWCTSETIPILYAPSAPRCSRPAAEPPRSAPSAAALQAVLWQVMYAFVVGGILAVLGLALSWLTRPRRTDRLPTRRSGVLAPLDDPHRCHRW